MKTRKAHVHEWTRSKPTATVDTCYCGKFRHNENNTNPIIVEQTKWNERTEENAGIDNPDNYRPIEVPMPLVLENVVGHECVYDADGGLIATFQDPKLAAFVVRAVNSFDELTVENTRLRHAHEELLAHLRTMVGIVDTVVDTDQSYLSETETQALKEARKAIAKASGGI